MARQELKLMRPRTRLLASSTLARVGWRTMNRGLRICLLVIVLTQSASAHPVPFSFLDLYVTPSGMEASLVLHDFDVAHDLGITPVERLHDEVFLAERASSIQALLADRLQIFADGKALKPDWG